ncbi:uncharacterized protein LOC135395293 [Ornithodoros turicata]|uniref:uncharacterized protein LOC135395293 n=1 Tax=Ornithodoros turicata TaxID=34597 RepID=UPI0031397A87
MSRLRHAFRDIWIICAFEYACLIDAHGANMARLCGKPLNPIETARMAKMAAQGFAPCARDLGLLGISPKLKREATRGCVLMQLCYAYADNYKNDTPAFKNSLMDCLERTSHMLTKMDPELFIEEYHFNTTAFFEKGRRCFINMLPADGRLALGTMGSFLRFLSL